MPVQDIITKLEEALLLEPKKHAGIMEWFHGLRKSRDKGKSSWGEPDPEFKLSCRQRSPFLQNNYRDSSFSRYFSVSILFIKWICISKSCAAFVTRENIISESM
ncbi:hypothetical protein YC2023_065715 [Brassica napus]